MEASLDRLLAAQRGLSERFDDFRGALARRDEAAYGMALADFHVCLRRWTAAEEQVLLPALGRVVLPGRDPQREVRLECVQVRELTRYLLTQVTERARLSDILGLADNLAQRLAAHRSEMERVYYPALAPELTAEEWRILEGAAPAP